MKKRYGVFVTLALFLLVGGVLAGCKHWPEGQYPSRQAADRDGGGDGGGGGGGGGGSGGY